MVQAVQREHHLEVGEGEVARILVGQGLQVLGERLRKSIGWLLHVESLGSF